MSAPAVTATCELQSEAAFKKVRDTLASRILDIGFASLHNRAGLLLYGTVCLMLAM